MSTSTSGFKFDLQAQSLANCRFLSNSRTATFFAVTAKNRQAGLYKAIVFYRDRDEEGLFISSRFESTVDSACKSLHDALAEKVYKRYEAAPTREKLESETLHSTEEDEFEVSTKISDNGSDFSRDIPTPDSDSDSDSTASESEVELVTSEPRRRKPSRNWSQAPKHRALSSQRASQFMPSSIAKDGTGSGNELDQHLEPIGQRGPHSSPLRSLQSPPRADLWHQKPASPSPRCIQVSHPQPTVPPPAVDPWQPTTSPASLAAPGTYQFPLAQPPAPLAAVPAPTPPPPMQHRRSALSDPQQQGATYLARLHITWNGREALTLQHIAPFLGAIKTSAMNYVLANLACFNKTQASLPYGQHTPPPHPLRATVRQVQLDGQTYEASTLCGSADNISNILGGRSSITAFKVHITGEPFFSPPPPPARMQAPLR